MIIALAYRFFEHEIDWNSAHQFGLSVEDQNEVWIPRLFQLPIIKYD